MTLTKNRGFDKLKNYAYEAAELLRVLGNMNRLQLLCQIAAGERSVGQLEDELEIRQPALSQQLAELRKAGIVQTRRVSRSIYYSLADTRVRTILEALRTLYCDGFPSASAMETPLGAIVSAAGPAGDTARFASVRRSES
jgi:ArsR family transcriptional regulator